MTEISSVALQRRVRMVNGADVETQARQLGWVPQEEFRGEAEKWVDAETFVDKGRHIMPILQENNRRLTSELESVKARQAATDAALKAAQDALAEMEERHTIETQKAVDQARKDLKAQLRAASEAGDHDAIAELTDQLSLMQPQTEKPKPGKASEEAPPKLETPQELLDWQKDNPWFGVDNRKTAMANAIAVELRQKNSPLFGRAFYDAVAKEVEIFFNPPGDPRSDDKVEGSRGGSGSAGGGKTYADLPADAKQACDADLRARVGKDKKYKTAADWRQRYADLYFTA